MQIVLDAMTVMIAQKEAAHTGGQEGTACAVKQARPAESRACQPWHASIPTSVHELLRKHLF